MNRCIVILLFFFFSENIKYKENYVAMPVLNFVIKIQNQEILQQCLVDYTRHLPNGVNYLP